MTDRWAAVDAAAAARRRGASPATVGAVITAWEGSSSVLPPSVLEVWRGEMRAAWPELAEALDALASNNNL